MAFKEWVKGLSRHPASLQDMSGCFERLTLMNMACFGSLYDLENPQGEAGKGSANNTS